MLTQKQKRMLGEYLLLEAGECRLGGEPGWLDKRIDNLFGKGGLTRRRIIRVNGELKSFDANDEKFQNYCQDVCEEYLAKRDGVVLDVHQIVIDADENEYLKLLEKKTDFLHQAIRPDYNWKEAAALLALNNAPIAASYVQEAIEGADFSGAEKEIAFSPNPAKEGGFNPDFEALLIKGLTMANPALGVAAGMIPDPLLPSAKAARVGKKDYPTTVYCGDDIDCDAIRDKKNELGIAVVSLRSKDALEANNTIKRVIIRSRGFDGGMDIPGCGRLIRPNKFAKQLFLNYEICYDP